jgi:hypothetical protein
VNEPGVVVEERIAPDIFVKQDGIAEEKVAKDQCADDE